MGNLFSEIGTYLLSVLSLTLNQLVILLGPALILAFIVNKVSELLRNNANELLGNKFFLYFTAIGVAIHELGHAIFALLFGHGIIDIKLFQPNEHTLGYVADYYDADNVFQEIGNFFIGIGPIILGTIVIYLSSKFLISTSIMTPLMNANFDLSSFDSLSGVLNFLKEVGSQSLIVFRNLINPSNLANWRFYLFVYIVFAIGSHIRLSPPDVDRMFEGFGSILGFLFMINLLTFWMGNYSSRAVNTISESYTFFYGLMLFVIVLNLVFLILVFASLQIRKLSKNAS